MMCFRLFNNISPTRKSGSGKFVFMDALRGENELFITEPPHNQNAYFGFAKTESPSFFWAFFVFLGKKSSN